MWKGFRLFKFGEGEDVFCEGVEAFGLALEDAQDFGAVGGRKCRGRIIGEEVDGAEDAGDGRLNFVGDVGDEIAAEIFELAHFGEEFFFGVAFRGDTCEACLIAAREKDEHEDDTRARAACSDEAPAGEVACIGDSLVGDGDTHDVVADAAGVVEGCDVERFGFAQDGASVAIT